MHERIVAVDSEGLVTIPREIRTMLGVPTGGLVAFVIHEEGHVELRSSPLTLDAVFGSVPGLPHESSDLEQEIEEAITEHITLRHPPDCGPEIPPVR